jgi:hypothetical protein
MDEKLGADNQVSRHIENEVKCADGRLRYPESLRAGIYGHIIRVAKEVRPDLEIALCLEEAPVWKAVGLEKSRGRCNCVL